ADQVARRLRHEDLPAVTGGSDPRSAVHVDADVAVLREQRLSGVQTHPNAHRAAVECITSLHGGGESVFGAVEGDEERVALGVHLDTTVLCESVSKRASVLGQSARVVVAELLEQTCRSLDVREEEGDRPGGQLAHGSIMRGWRSEV